MKRFFAYIRVSTVKQGEKGSSLQEQRDAIAAFTTRHDLSIVTWFEERETAAKLGRRQFARMLALLLKGDAQGVIFHKIDRGARNLEDWNNIQRLIDRGIDVRFAHESLDMNSRGGRLTADLLAVIATDYVRNLREEIRKGIRGRLKQGLYPLPAPIGYADAGRGKPKNLDPVRAPFIRKAFERYSSGGVCLRVLADELYRLGLRNRGSNKVDINRLSEILRQPFYTGLIHIKRTGETYQGVHPPIVSKSLFDRVQAVLSGKTNTRAIKHSYLFRRVLRCCHCGYALVGETQKGHVYYRCHTRGCATKCIREDAIEAAIRSSLELVTFTDEEIAELRTMVLDLKRDWQKRQQEELQALSLAASALKARLSRLIDAYLSGDIEKDLFEEKKRAMLSERLLRAEQMTNLHRKDATVADEVSRFLELAQSLSLSYESANSLEKRDLVESTTSNLGACRKNVVVELRSPFRELAERHKSVNGAPHRDTPRTATAEILQMLVKHFSKEATCDIPTL